MGRALGAGNFKGIRCFWLILDLIKGLFLGSKSPNFAEIGPLRSHMSCPIESARMNQKGQAGA